MEKTLLINDVPDTLPVYVKFKKGIDITLFASLNKKRDKLTFTSDIFHHKDFNAKINWVITDKVGIDSLILFNNLIGGKKKPLNATVKGK